MVGRAVTDPKQGFDLAFNALCQAADFKVAEIHFGHALTDFYSLYELAKQPPLTKAARDAALDATDGGKTALAIVWARKFRTHDVVEVSQAADLYSRYYTKLYGVLAWRPRCDFTASTDDRGWHDYYDRHLEGRPVLDTMQAAISAVTAMIPGSQ
jgi:hypothetical protein